MFSVMFCWKNLLWNGVMGLLAVLLFVALPLRAKEEEWLSQDGFRLPKPGTTFSFPRDHGSHPDFRTEWWYVTGHLDDDAGGRYGFQLTFFRQAQRGQDGQLAQLHLAHAAVSDVSSGQFLHEEKLQRAGWAAGAAVEQLGVNQDQWYLRSKEEGVIELGMTVKGDAVLRLEMRAKKPLVVFGSEGVSRKGKAREAASHYLTYPRLGVQGELAVGEKRVSVKGEAWMDHEFSSSQLDEGQVGWDWAAMQFTDGREIMVYRMRREDGSTDAASVLTLVDEKCGLRVKAADAFQWRVLDHWVSPKSGAKYPARVEVKYEGECWQLRPVMADQEQGGSLTGLPYWEGACDILDAKGAVVGRAFMELAGYAGKLSDHLRGDKSGAAEK
jgi:predicted secreted hydrolase